MTVSIAVGAMSCTIENGCNNYLTSAGMRKDEDIFLKEIKNLEDAFFEINRFIDANSIKSPEVRVEYANLIDKDTNKELDKLTIIAYCGVKYTYNGVTYTNWSYHFFVRNKTTPLIAFDKDDNRFYYTDSCHNKQEWEPYGVHKDIYEQMKNYIANTSFHY